MQSIAMYELRKLPRNVVSVLERFWRGFGEVSSKGRVNACATSQANNC
jgi:hypothetical protein